MIFKGTTILSVRKDDQVVIGGDGQVTFGNVVMKQKANKLRTLYDGRILAGFAGSVADALTLFERFEKKLAEYGGNLLRASVELAKEWRYDKYLRKLEALLGVADIERSLIISGSGDIIEPENGFLAIGSGSEYARSAAIALLENFEFDAEQIVLKSLKIASSICIYTNENILTLKLTK